MQKLAFESCINTWEIPLEILNTSGHCRYMCYHLTPTRSILKVSEMCVSHPSMVIAILQLCGRLTITHHTLELAAATYICIWRQLTIFGCKCKPFYLFTAGVCLARSSHLYLSPLTPTHTDTHFSFPPSVPSYCIILAAL